MSNTIFKKSSTIFASMFLFLSRPVFFNNPADFENSGERNEVFTSYTELFDISELKHSVFAYKRAFSSSKLGFGVQRFGNDIYSEEVWLLNFCRRFVDKLSVGVNIKEMRVGIESLNKYSVSGVDAGMQYDFHKNIRFVCAMDSLPVVYRAGISYNVFEGVVWMFDWEKEEDFEDDFHIGQEISLDKFLFLRAGYETNPSSINGGLGFRVDPVQINYDVFSHPVLGNTQVVSFIIRW